MMPPSQSNSYWLELDERYRLRGGHTAQQVWVRGEGIQLWDADGQRYLDFESGQVCVATGHCHPRYVEAITAQARQLIQTGSAFTNPPQVRLAEKVAALAPAGLDKSIFFSTGSESNEAALRLAKFYTHRFEVASLIRGYHGMTHGSLAITGFGGSYRSVPGTGLTGVVFLASPYMYRCPFAGCEGRCNLSCAHYAEETIDWTSSGKLAAIIVETIQSAGGMVVLPPEYLREIRRICDERGALMIVDEAQTGFGRTGRWWGIDHSDILPDVITISKSLGGGVPLSGLVTRSDIAARLMEDGYYQSSSHTGDPFLAAVGLANIEIIEDECLVENAAKTGAYLQSQLGALADQYEIVGDVRGHGLMLGVEIVTDRETREPGRVLASTISQYALDHGLLLGHRPRGVVSGHVIRLLPPLTINRAEVDEALGILAEALTHAMTKRGAEKQATTAWV